MRPWHTITSTDIVASLFIVAAIVGMFMDVNQDYTSALTLISGYYFGKKASTLPPDGGAPGASGT